MVASLQITNKILLMISGFLAWWSLPELFDGGNATNLRQTMEETTKSKEETEGHEWKVETEGEQKTRIESMTA